jgi:hypothetical protein
MHSIQFKDEDYDVTSAKTLEEILALGKASWTKYDLATFNGVLIHFYRKPKRFGSLQNFRISSQARGLAT